MPELHLSHQECNELAERVKNELIRFYPNSKAALDGFGFSSELIAKPTRINAPVTVVHLDTFKQTYVDCLREQIQGDHHLKEEEKEEKLQLLDTMLFYGQLLFSQQSSFYFLDKSLEDINKIEGDEHLKTVLSEKMASLKQLTEEEGIKSEDKKIDVLSRWQKYNEVLQEIDTELRKSPGNTEIKARIQANLDQAKGFFSQANDLNFDNANKPSRPWSTFVNAVSKYGSIVSLAAAMISIVAIGMSFIPVLTPVMAPLAAASTVVALSVGASVQAKDLSTMIYNKIRFDKNPTHTEVVNASLFAAGILTAGLTTVSKAAHVIGVFGRAEAVVARATRAANSMTNTSVFLDEEIEDYKENQETNTREKNNPKFSDT